MMHRLRYRHRLLLVNGLCCRCIGLPEHLALHIEAWRAHLRALGL